MKLTVVTGLDNWVTLDVHQYHYSQFTGEEGEGQRNELTRLRE